MDFRRSLAQKSRQPPKRGRGGNGGEVCHLTWPDGQRRRDGRRPFHLCSALVQSQGEQEQEQDKAPRRDHANFSPAAVARLASIPNFIAYKDGQGDIRKFQQIIARVGDRLHWIGGAGDDCVPAYYSLGVRTYTSSIANVAPRLSRALHDLASERTAAADAKLTQLMRELVTPLYAFRGRKKGYEVSVMKTMMDLTGQVGGQVRPPLNDLTPAEVKEWRTLIKAWRKWL